MVIINAVRAYAFLAGVFRNQQRDSLCGNCKAFVNSVNTVRASMQQFGSDHASDLSDNLSRRYTETKSALEAIVLPENVSGQKKAGNCLMPPGVCFVKASLVILEKSQVQDMK